MTGDRIVKAFIALSIAAAAAVAVVGSGRARPGIEEERTRSLAENAAAGEAAYEKACSACHAPFDPRFHLYAEWKQIIESSGCPKADAGLDDAARKSLLGYLMTSSAGTADEALKIRDVGRKSAREELDREGQDVFKSSCASCHGHPLYSRTHTASEWRTLAGEKLPKLHEGSKEEIALGRREALALRTHLEANAACGPADARIFRIIVEKGGLSGDFAQDDDFAAVRWVKDYEKGMAEASRLGKPVLLNLTIEGGT